ncbi:Uma2 family endonuclease, partial [Halothece sp. PCC 7418]|uniref:Uma2 family endonuclease n=1 Tax=Halothece sp. (strain PCC 7418) TaxID=65093 RepID=UPI0002E354E2
MMKLKIQPEQFATIALLNEEYRENGVRLGWLINPQDQQVKIYRQGCDREILDQPQVIDGEDVLPNFELSLENIF